MRWCQLSDRFLLPQYKQGHAFSGHAAPHGPGAVREVGRVGGSEREREGQVGRVVILLRVEQRGEVG